MELFYLFPSQVKTTGLVRYTLEHFLSLKKAMQMIDAEVNTPTA